MKTGLKLYATPLSHYSRKIRLLLDHYGVSYDVVDPGNVADAPRANFADNPLMRVPVLVDGSTWLIESDHIAAYLARKYDSADRFEVHTTDPFDLNARAVMNGIMVEEVDIIIAKRMHVPIEQYSFFDKAFEAIHNGLEWLESHADRFDHEAPKYRDWHIVCIWEHLKYYDLMPLNYPKLRETVDRIAALPLVQKSAPYVLKPKV